MESFSERIFHLWKETNTNDGRKEVMTECCRQCGEATGWDGVSEGACDKR
jgi:hypothetical protein